MRGRAALARFCTFVGCPFILTRRPAASQIPSILSLPLSLTLSLNPFCSPLNAETPLQRRACAHRTG
ncbi:hypothetical protein QQF64_016028 [Cirrhinus molitorella]|uniref:Uncharacterized protein n=1 Tax=Cirrhinus molitorella TaxID=172907 RepID=A0ABR3LQ55_9TELE